MFCKNCGNEIDDESKFCKFCGIDLSESKKESRTELNKEDYIVNLKLEGKINHSIKSSPTSFLSSLLQKHPALSCSYIIWLVLNLVFLAAGENESGFWPYIDADRCSWDLDRYGLMEFLVYAILIPFATLSLYKGLIKINNKNKPETPAENKKNVIFLIIFILFDVAFLYWITASYK